MPGCETDDIVARFVRTEAYRHHETGKISDAAYFEILAHVRSASPLSDAQFLEGWNAIFAGEMPGIAPLLARAAKHLPLYVFSNTNHAHVEYFSAGPCRRARPFPRNLLLVLDRASETGRRRPIDHVVKSIGVPAGRIVFFDDLAENVESARARGLKAVHVKSSGDVADALAALGI